MTDNNCLPVAVTPYKWLPLVTAGSVIESSIWYMDQSISPYPFTKYSHYKNRKKILIYCTKWSKPACKTFVDLEQTQIPL